MELAELDAILRVKSSHVKAFLSRSVDRYRPPYGRRAVDVPRQCVFAGTVNHDTYLSDETGGRRFWPVRVGEIDLGNLGCDRDQLWAEAVCRYHVDEPWWLDTPELEALAEAEQQERYDEDPWQQLIATHVGSKESISIDEILEECIHKPPAEQSQRDKNRVSRCLQALGFKRYKQRVDGRHGSWRYRRVSS